MKIVWEYSVETEAKRVLHTAHQIAVGFYRLNGFYVLPYSPKNKDFGGNLVYFPDLPYHKIKRFWEEVKRIDIRQIPIKADPKLISATENLIKENPLPRPDVRKNNGLKKMAKSLLTEAGKTIPFTKNAITKITIYPTTLGTKCSFNTPHKFPADIYIYLRNDQDIYSGLAEAILTAITRENAYHLGGNWQESEFLVDWLISESSIGKIIGKYHPKKFFSPTIKSVHAKQSAKILEASEAFYRKLGIPTLTKPFSLNGLTPEINQKPVENLSPKEKIFLRKLIENANQVVTFDEIANSAFTGDDDFSLYAISKTTERLRNKLEANGISSSYIQTLRGKGYVLKN